MSKKNLTKLALVGLLVASTEATINASDSINAGFQKGTLLAGGCSSCKAIAWEQTPSYNNSGNNGNNTNPNTIPTQYSPSNSKRSASYTADNTVNNIGESTETDAKAESEFVSKLNINGKQTYWSLTPPGRKMALQLANQGKEANAAVKEAAEQTNGMNPVLKKY